MQDRMNRMNRLFRESYSPEGPEEALTTTSFAPPVDIYEDEHNITLKLEVPGIDEKDIDVRVDNNTLTVHGERKIEKEEERGELPSRRAAIRKLYPLVHFAQLRGPGTSKRGLQPGCAEDHARQEGRSQAQADQSQRGGEKTLEAKAAGKAA